MSSQSYIYNPTERTLAAAGDGFSCPRLTTAGRTSLALTANDKGMMVYDTTLTDLCIWNGSAWEFVSDNSNGIVSVKDFGAKGDGVTNDTAAFTASMTFAAANGNLYVYVPAGTYVVSSTISVPSQCGFFGTGGSTISFTGAGVCFLCGTALVKSNKMAISDLRIILTAITSTAIQLDNSVDSEIKDIYIEGPYSDFATRTNVGVLITGNLFGSWFNNIQNVDCNHVHIGFKVLGDGAVNPSYPTEQLFINCCSLGDLGVGDVSSAGFLIQGKLVGNGTVITGGNVENTGTGISLVSPVGSEVSAFSVFGLRFEANTVDVAFDAATGCSISSTSLNYTKITGSKIDLNNLQILNTNQVNQGIRFPATQVPSSNPNTLDDYEEGIWVPVIADASTGGNTGTYALNHSRYVKVGRQVSLECYISAINTTGMTAGNTFFIRGLPFAAQHGGQGNFYTYRVGRNASTVSSSANVPDNASWVQFNLYSTNSATADLNIIVSNIVSGTSEIILSVTYFAAN